MCLFKKKREKAEEKAYDVKDKYIASVLGEEYDRVLHAIIPYAIGGGLDLFLYSNYCEGTAIVTKEISNHKFNKPSNDVYDAYELVMITRHKIDMDNTLKENPPENTFAYDLQNINSLLNIIGPYATTAKLNPNDTVEIPEDMGDVSGKCMILDALTEPLCNKDTRHKKIGIMLLMEIHRDEMEYAMQQKGRELIEKLKEKGVYPYTGINRPSVMDE